jgi:hypothetical protein
MRENQLNELQGVSILTKEFHNKIIRRIECTKPLAGTGITISEKENGFEVSLGDLSFVSLNVCRNGVEETIQVLAKT